MKNKLPLQPKEHDIQDIIIEYLQRKKWYVQRMNSGRIRAQSVKKVKYGKVEVEVPTERNINLNDPGTPDIMAFKDVTRSFIDNGKRIKLLFIEVKRPGNKPTVLQKAKMKELEEYGAQCIVATCVDDLMALGI